MVPENMHTLPAPHKEFPKRGGGFRNLTKKLKKFMKLNLNFPEGKGAGEKISLIGEVWIFSGTTTHFYQKPAPVYQYLPTNWDVEMFLKVFSYGFSV